MSERRLAARPGLATSHRYFCNVKRRMRLTPSEWNNAVENAAGWCMRQLALGYGWETVYEGRAFARFLQPLALVRRHRRKHPSTPGCIFSLRWMQTSQPRAFYTSPPSRGGAPHGVQKRADRFLPQPPLRKFRNFRSKKKSHLLIYLARNVADWRIKLFHFPHRRDYRDARLHARPIVKCTYESIFWTQCAATASDDRKKKTIISCSCVTRGGLITDNISFQLPAAPISNNREHKVIHT